MSRLRIACLLSPMADTEGPMEIQNGKVLSGSKKIMGKYGEVGLEAAITFGEEHPDRTHLDILSVGKEKELTSLQQTAIAMIQPGKHPATLGTFALHVDPIDELDGFAVTDLLVALIGRLDEKPGLIFTGRESWDYSHGIVGPALAQHLGMPYFSGVNEIKLNEDFQSVSATFIEGNDKIVQNIQLPAVFGTTDWLNGKDSARFTSLKGVMMAKKFKRTTLTPADLGNPASSPRTTILGIEPVTSERRNHVLSDGEGTEKAKLAADLLIHQHKALSIDAKSDGGVEVGQGTIQWSNPGPDGLNFQDDILVLASHDGSQVRLSTHQVMSQARKVADAVGKKVSLMVFAKDLAKLGSSCGGSGADRVIGFESASFEHPAVETYANALSSLNSQVPSFIFTVATDMGRDLAAFLASRFDGGLLQDVTSLAIEGGRLTGNRIVSNARFQTEETILDQVACQVVSVRASAFDPLTDTRPVSYEKISLGQVLGRARVQQVVQGAEIKGIPLNEAKIIVSGGRGLKAAENFKHLQELADLLGGAMGASRAVTDLEWVPHNLQIGQTGTTVAPDLYIAVGISGAIQHLTGMLGSKYILAVNPDADAPIHKHADLSIIDKWENVIPPFIEEIKKVLGQ